MMSGNIQVLETLKITQNKYLQIVRAGDKYLVIAVCKDTVTMLAEVSKESLVPEQSSQQRGMQMGFGEILDKMKNRDMTEKMTDEEK